jgi:N-acetylglucosaminyldiphosphoundecaprenol N-acetyl-beta-D-mannosaminyltransferase
LKKDNKTVGEMIKENIFTFPISIGSYRGFINEVFSLAKRKSSSYVCFANVHMTVEAFEDNNFNAVLKNADIIAPDGKPLTLFLKQFKKINQERVCGLDIFPDLLKEAAVRGTSVFFYGTTDAVLEKICQRARRELPTLDIRGCYAPPFRPLSDEEESQITQRINEASPDLIFVALGCPKQEKWMADHKGKISGCMLGVGQAFNVYAGLAKRSPVWMQRSYLEWAFRLFQDPRRLWKRYFYTNTCFLILTVEYTIYVAMEMLSSKFAHRLH